MTDGQGWAAAVARWAASGPAGDASHGIVWPDSRDAAPIIDGLVARLRRLGLPDYAAADAASEAVELMGRAVGRGSVDPYGNPASFLLTVARRRGIDAARSAERSYRRTELAGKLDHDAADPIDSLLDAVSSVQVLASAMRGADPTTRRVASAFIDLAHLYGDRPTADAVAKAAGVSRKTVFASLHKLRHGLAAIDPPRG